MAGAVPETLRWKEMMESFLDPKYGVVAGAGIREGMVLEKLQELLVVLSTTLQKLDRVIPAEGAPTGDAASPYFHSGGFILLGSALIAAFSLAGLLYLFFFLFFYRAEGGDEGGGAAWVQAAKALKGVSRGEGKPTMSEHECLYLSIGTLLLVITFLGGFYYYYCYQAGCFGGVGPMAAASAGRKLRVI